MKKFLLIVCGVVMTGACGGGGGGGGYTPPAGPPAIFVSISPATQTNIDQGQTVRFSATVQNDSSTKGVTWRCSGAGLGAACGSFSDSSTSSATYNAPPAVSGNVGITVIATSIADATKAGSAMVMVSPPPALPAALCRAPLPM